MFISLHTLFLDTQFLTLLPCPSLCFSLSVSLPLTFSHHINHYFPALVGCKQIDSISMKMLLINPHSVSRVVNIIYPRIFNNTEQRAAFNKYQAVDMVRCFLVVFIVVVNLAQNEIFNARVANSFI